MLENPGDELYFGEVYRTVLQEAWLPAGGEVWQRTGISRRGRRPTQQGLIAGTPTQPQAVVRQCFSRCVAAWNALPWDNPADTTCDNRWGRQYWKKMKDERGLQCSYYDLFMKHCMRYCLDTQCVPPANYLLSVTPILTDVECNKVYDLSFSNKCGDVQMLSGEGEFVAPSEWIAPKCGQEGILCFQDQNGSLGFTTFRFSPLHWCIPFIWPAYNPTDIDPGITKPIYVEGGVSPYFWEITATNMWLEHSGTQEPVNSLHARDNACGTAFISVTDSCGNECAGILLSSLGYWALKEADNMDACGLPGHGVPGGGGATWELIIGNRKQTQGVYKCGTAVMGCGAAGHSWLCGACCNPGGGCAGWKCMPCIDYWTTWQDYLVPYVGYSVGGEPRCNYNKNTYLNYYEWECPL